MVREEDDDQVSYPNLLELPDGGVLVTFVHIPARGPGSWVKRQMEYVYLDPDTLEESDDSEDFSRGLEGWSLNGTVGATAVARDGDRVLQLQTGEGQPLAAERNFPLSARGQLTFEICRLSGSAGVDLLLDETFWRPNDRRAEPAVEIDLGADRIPAGEWVPVRVTWDVNAGEAEVKAAGCVRTVPVGECLLGICYLTFHGRSEAAEPEATFVRRMRIEGMPRYG
jgi:hypothetical protein